MIILAILLLVFDKPGSFLERVHKALSVVAAPIQYTVDWPVQFVKAMANNFSYKQTLVEQNASLKAQLLITQAQLQKAIALEKENLELHNLLQSVAHKENKVLVARILEVDSAPYINEIVIDKGSKSDISEGQAVLDANGIFGQVIHVGPLTSRVMLITDPRSGVPVQVMRNGLRAIAIGTGETDSLTLSYLSTTADIKAGDELVSSNLGDRFPQGYPVAIVTSVKTQAGSSFLTVKAKPTANLDGANLVLLTWPQQQANYGKK